jgi:hypothetical protein
LNGYSKRKTGVIYKNLYSLFVWLVLLACEFGGLLVDYRLVDWLVGYSELVGWLAGLLVGLVLSIVW